MEGGIQNKVSEAGLITIDLLNYVPQGERRGIDLKDWLIDGLIIKEVEFKKKLDEFNFSSFKSCYVYIYCSEDVVIPVWAFLLLQTKLNPVAKYVFFGEEKELNLILFTNLIDKLKPSTYKGRRVFIKGCGDPSLPIGAFSIISQKLIPEVKSLFYGEACSNVPLIKNV